MSDEEEESQYSNPMNRKANDGVDSQLDIQFMKIDPEAKKRGFNEIIRDIKMSHLNETDAETLRFLYLVQRTLRNYTYKTKVRKMINGKIVKVFVEKYVYERTIDLLEFAGALSANISVGIGGKGIKSMNETIERKEFSGLDEKKESFLKKFRFNIKQNEG